MECYASRRMAENEALLGRIGTVLKAGDPVEPQVCAPLRAGFPDVEVAVDLTRLEGLALRVAATTARGERFPLADGGSLDWMARLLGNGKERMIASGFGPDLVASLFRP
jgi:hypothetical protein